MGHRRIPKVRELYTSFRGFSVEQRLAFIDNPVALKKFLKELVERSKTFFTYIDDKLAIETMISDIGFEASLARHCVARCREDASGYKYEGPLWLIVRAGYDLIGNSVSLGPCASNFANLGRYSLYEGGPTTHSLVYFRPIAVSGATSSDRNVRNQLMSLGKFRENLELPNWFFTGFGRASLLKGLILSHLNRTGESLFNCCNAVSTDTVAMAKGDWRVLLGPIGSDGLCSRFWRDYAPYKCGMVGCFPVATMEFPSE